MINKEQLHSYSLALAEKITSEYYAGKTEITGKEILTLTSIEQLNYFILKTLFGRWKDEEDKLRSPYFNYENEAVKEALANLLIQLSNNISIKREFFKPLLSKAIYDTLYFALEPLEYLQEYFSLKGKINVEDFKKESKYYKINKDFFNHILEKMEQTGKSILPGLEAAQIPKEVAGTVNSADAEKTLNGFSALLEIEIDKIVIKPKVDNTSPVISLNLPEKEEIKADPQIAAVPEKTEKELAKPEIEAPPVEEKQSEGTPTLNDLFRKKEESTLAETFRKDKIRQFRSYISLNQRFLFTGSLFGNNQEDFNKSVDIVEASSSYSDAKEKLYSSFSEQYKWQSESEELKEFLNLIELRFKD